jgi:hypothetical protein
MDIIKILIEKKDTEKYKKSLDYLSFEDLSYEENNDLLIKLLEMIQKYDFQEGLKITLHFWGSMETGFDDFVGEIYPIIPTLFLDNIPFHLLYYIMTTLSNVVSVEEVAIELFQKGEGESLKIALKNLFDMLGTPSGTTYRLLWDEAMNSKNSIAIEFMSGLQSKYSGKSDKPSYVLENEDKIEEKDLLLIVDDIISEMCPFDTIDNCVNLLIKGLVKHGLDLLDMDKTKELLYHKLSSMDEEERTRYLSSFVIDQLKENESLFHILGPLNDREYESEKKNDSICDKYGCRMLYCDCFEFHLIDPETESSSVSNSRSTRWFKGECEKCSRKIPKRCYAVRCPLEKGGWLGTYCSWNCLYLSGNGDEDLICKYEKEMNEKKIIDREEM